MPIRQVDGQCKEWRRNFLLHISTISPEIERNSGKRGYRLNQADSKAVERRRAVSMNPHKMTPGLVEKIEGKINLDWSPE